MIRHGAVTISARSLLQRQQRGLSTVLVPRPYASTYRSTTVRRERVNIGRSFSSVPTALIEEF